VRSSASTRDFPLHERRRAAIDALISLAAVAGTTPGIYLPDFQAVAESLGWGCARTVQRYMAKGGYAPQRRTRYEIDPTAIRTLIRCRGRSKWAYRRMCSEHWHDHAPVTYETFRTAVNRLPSAWRAAMRDGDAARRDRELDIFIGHQLLYEVLAIDEKQMSLAARHPKTGIEGDVWVLAPICETSRVVTHAHVCADSPSADDVLDALVGAMLPSPEFPYAGRPWAVRWDNAHAHIAYPVTDALSTLGIPVIFMNAYSPWENPYAESFNSMLEEWAATQPTYKHGPTMRNRDYVNKNALLPEFEVYRQRIIELTRGYNSEHVHSSLGCTPDAFWTHSPHKPPLLKADDIRWMNTATRESRVVTRHGVRVDNDFYVHPLLYDLIGTPVMAHKRRNQDETAEIFDLKGSHLYTAINRKHAPDSMWVDTQDHQTKSRREYRAYERDALAEADRETSQANANLTSPSLHTTPAGRRRAASEAQFAGARPSSARVTGRTAGDHSKRRRSP
jgi:transposase InsO family protein